MSGVPAREDGRMKRARLGLVAAVLLLLAVAYRLGAFEQLTEPRRLAQSMVELGGWGHAAFILSYALLQPFGVPGTIFIVAAPLIWPWQTAFGLSMAGTMAASVIGFAFARFVARDWVTPRIPARLRKYDEALERNAFETVVILRVLLWMPQPLHWFFGVSKVGFWTHFWGSVLGYVPPLLAVSYLGAEMFDPSGKMKPDALPIMAGMWAVSLAFAGLAWLRAKHVAKRQGDSVKVSGSS